MGDYVITLADKDLKVHTRWMIRRDFPEVLDFEDRDPHGWSEALFLATLRQRDTIGLVAEDPRGVVGVVVYTLHKHHLGLLRLAVHPSVRRRRVGAQLVARLVAKLGIHKRQYIDAVVRESDMGALKFFRACGFRAVELWREHFEDDDGYLMRFELPESHRELGGEG